MDYRRIKTIEKKLDEIEQKKKADEEGNHFTVLDSNGELVKVKFDKSHGINYSIYNNDGSIGIHFVDAEDIKREEEIK